MTTPPDPDDAARALPALYDQALPIVYGYFVRRCADRGLAEDLTSETFLAAMDAARKKDPPAMGAPWLIGWHDTSSPTITDDGWQVQGARPMAGVGGGSARPTTVPMWTVSDMESAVARVREAGGTVLAEPARQPMEFRPSAQTTRVRVSTSTSSESSGSLDRLITARCPVPRTGLTGLSLNLIVADAGVAKGTFFHHLGDRASYLIALHREFHERLTTQIQNAIADMPPGRGRPIAVANTYLDGCLRDRGVRAPLLEARAELAVTDEIGRRNNAGAEFCRADFSALRRRHPYKSAQLWIGMVAEAALIEHQAGTALPAFREAVEQFPS